MKTDIYYEPQSRLQLLDKLRHLAHFSDFLLLLAGEKGSGKTRLLEQIIPAEDDTTLCCYMVRPAAEMDAETLLEQLVEQMPSHDEAGVGFADQLRVFHLQLRAITAVGQKCLIIIDDAEFLSNDALGLLMNLHAADIQLLLSSEIDFAEALLESDAIKFMDGGLHYLLLERITDDEVIEYLRLCHPTITLRAAEKTKLIKYSQGIFGRVEAFIAGEETDKLEPTSNSAKKFPLPLAHMLGIGTILVIIVGISLWQFLPDSLLPDSTNQNTTVAVSLPVAGITTEQTSGVKSMVDSGLRNKQDVDSTEESQQAKKIQLERARIEREKELLLAIQQQLAEEKRRAEERKAENERLLRAKAAELAVISLDKKMRLAEQQRKAAATRLESPATDENKTNQKIALQIVSVKQDDLPSRSDTKPQSRVEVKEPSDSAVQPTEVKVAVIDSNNSPSVVVVEPRNPSVVIVDKKQSSTGGLAANESSVVAVESSMPSTIVQQTEEPVVVAAKPDRSLAVAMNPALPSVVAVQPESTPVVAIEPKRSSVVAVQPESTPVVAIEPKRSSVVAVQPESETVVSSNPFAEYEEEIMGWSKTDYTLQLMAARSVKSVYDFVNHHKKSSDIYAFETLHRKRLWYVVIYGHYSNKAAAKAAIAKLPPTLRKIEPWIRSIQGVQADIRNKR